METKGKFDDIIALTKSFENLGICDTAKEIKNMVELLKESRIDKALSNFEKLLPMLTNEWGSSKYRKELLQAVSPIFQAVIDSRPNEFENLQEIVELVQMMGNMREAVNILVYAGGDSSMQEPAPYKKLLILSLIYQITAEGIFDESLKFLTFLANLSKGRNISLSNLEGDDAQKLRFKLESVPVEAETISLLYEGYYQDSEKSTNHLRNAIAHARFSYDSNNNIMSFHDYHNGRKTWGPVKIDYSTLKDDWFQKLQDVATLTTLLFGLLLIYVILQMLLKWEAQTRH